MLIIRRNIILHVIVFIQIIVKFIYNIDINLLKDFDYYVTKMFKYFFMFNSIKNFNFLIFNF